MQTNAGTEPRHALWTFAFHRSVSTSTNSSDKTRMAQTEPNPNPEMESLHSGDAEGYRSLMEDAGVAEATDSKENRTHSHLRRYVARLEDKLPFYAKDAYSNAAVLNYQVWTPHLPTNSR